MAKKAVNKRKPTNLFIVSGTSRGLGLKLAEEIKKQPDNVLLAIGRKKSIHADFNIIVDLKDYLKLEKELNKGLVKINFGEYKKIILIHNAATVTPIGGLHELKSDEIIQHQNINTISPIILMKNIIAKHQKAGKKNQLTIVNISSGAAFHAIAGWSQYCSSKSAMHMLIRNLRLDYEKDKSFQAFSFSPGVMDTDMQGNIRAEKSKYFSRKKDFLQMKKENILLTNIAGL